MTHDELTKLLTNSGFDTGWILTDKILVLWEHDAEPPAPLTRPEPINEPTDEPTEP
jgi:hypothetical protein